MKHKVTLKSKDKTRTEIIDPNSEVSLLICMERKQMDVQYGCLSGVCEACAIENIKAKKRNKNETQIEKARINKT